MAPLYTDGIMPPKELMNLPSVVDLLAVLPMRPNCSNPVNLVLSGSRESSVRLLSQLAHQSFDPARPVLRLRPRY
jgi:hypothetical protein